MDTLNTLEDILNTLGSEDPFLIIPKDLGDGHKEYFTETGGQAYGKLTEILYAVGRLCGQDMDNMVETLDNIASNEY